MESIRQAMQMSTKGFCQVAVVLAGIAYMVLAILYLNYSDHFSGSVLECSRQVDESALLQPGH